MRRITLSRTLPPLLTVACLMLPLPAGAAEAPVGERVAAVQQTQTQAAQDWLAEPNAREDRIARYSAWAVQNPELERPEVVLQVNLDLDRAPYENVQTIADPGSLAVLVNKHYALPADYVPELEALGTGYGSGSLRPEAAQAFRAMADAARLDGVTLHSVSAYRSYTYQNALYYRYLTQYRQSVVDTFSARAGHSEHQTGLALDINTASTSAHFERTPAYAWLQAHCAEYGFILRYAQDKQSITGYRFEPWHYRYVGQAAAQVCMEQGLSYEEYLALGLDASTKAEAEQPDTDPVPEESVPEEKPVPEAPSGAGKNIPEIRPYRVTAGRPILV